MHVLKYITFFFSYKPSFCFFHCSLVFFLQPCLSAFLLLWVCIVVLCFLWTELPLLRGEYCIQFLLQLLLASCLLSPCLFLIVLFLRYPFFPLISQKKTILVYGQSWFHKLRYNLGFGLFCFALVFLVFDLILSYCDPFFSFLCWVVFPFEWKGLLKFPILSRDCVKSSSGSFWICLCIKEFMLTYRAMCHAF